MQYLIRINTVTTGLKQSGHLYAVVQKGGRQLMECMCLAHNCISKEAYFLIASSNAFPILVCKNDQLDFSKQTHPTVRM